MGIRCLLFSHRWKDCACAWCGRTRHELDGQCVCARCGQTLHDYETIKYDKLVYDESQWTVGTMGSATSCEVAYETKCRRCGMKEEG